MVETALPGACKVQVCYATPQRQWLIDLDVAPGSTVHQAILASGIMQQVAEIDLSVWRVGVFGKLCELDRVLTTHDRIEIYRPLQADPMESRRRRADKKGK
jgi:uncharacterized protein